MTNQVNSELNNTINQDNIIESIQNFLKKNIEDVGIGEIVFLLKSEYILDVLKHKYPYRYKISHNNQNSFHTQEIPISHAIAIHSANILVHSGHYFMKLKKYIESSLAKIVEAKTKTEEYEQQELKRYVEIIKGILLIIKKMLCGVEFLYSVPMRDLDGTNKYLPANVFSIPIELYEPMLAEVENMYQQFFQQDKEKANTMMNNFFSLFTMNYRIILKYLKAMRGFIDQLTDICPLERRSMASEIYSLAEDLRPPYDLVGILHTISPNDQITTHAKAIKNYIADGSTTQRNYSLEQIIEKLTTILSSPVDNIATLYHLMLSVSDLISLLPQIGTKIKTNVDDNNQRLIKIQEAINSMYNSRKMGVDQFIRFSSQLVNNIITLTGLANINKIDVEKILPNIRNAESKTKINTNELDTQNKKDEPSINQEKKKFSDIIDKQYSKDEVSKGIASFK